MMFNKRPRLTLLAAALACSFAAGAAQAAATIVINNANAAGVGFNDATPATPVGGNTGTTVGAQRLIAFTHAANIWGATVTSAVPIVINAQFRPLTCTATGAVLGSAGATQIFADFPGAPKAGTLYSYALANKLYGAEISDEVGPQINANFNSELGKANCLTGTSFYLGLDANHGSNIDFVATLLHEMGHGLGFQTFTSGLTGSQLAGYPSVWDHFLLDNTTNKLWVNMTAAERVASSLKPAGLSWTGARVTAAVPKVLSATPQLRLVGYGAKQAASLYAVGAADFGPAIGSAAVTGEIAKVALQADSPGSACTPFNPANTASVYGKIALVSRGTCGFTIKVKNAQNAGAIGVIVADNVAAELSGLGGADPSITIPAVRVTQADGAAIGASLSKPNGDTSGTVGKLELSKTLIAGTDSQRRITMYTPNPYESGSSVSHYNTSARRNQLMEPAISADLTHSLTVPVDLTFELLKDIGW
ncbi:PA domain-containing protein [Massilia sp. TSP1-1-2]|uniref:PA domain-containing protein n=1 Tax=Massilia sp. TSP1-1-2 TaxID=2804649 RepID=UPI003CF11104